MFVYRCGSEIVKSNVVFWVVFLCLFFFFLHHIKMFPNVMVVMYLWQTVMMAVAGDLKPVICSSL